ncbi:hypothetical protein C5612_29270 [Pseudomonas frederiksbergensis]|uniref:Uncharacterized protein n=1 Tax=Pseudomonas frederiksbergensis TaxID=104087 RepID=A0A2S8H625_9PSED|nr:hypothetical protein C5612_29270 [Pseudomonas frederiksbergensis]
MEMPQTSTMQSPWRGGLPPFDCEAVAKTCIRGASVSMGAASRPNGGKPPRHRSIRNQWPLPECPPAWPAPLPGPLPASPFLPPSTS